MHYFQNIFGLFGQFGTGQMPLCSWLLQRKLSDKHFWQPPPVQAEGLVLRIMTNLLSLFIYVLTAQLLCYFCCVLTEFCMSRRKRSQNSCETMNGLIRVKRFSRFYEKSCSNSSHLEHGLSQFLLPRYENPRHLRLHPEISQLGDHSAVGLKCGRISWMHFDCDFNRFRWIGWIICSGILIR